MLEYMCSQCEHREPYEPSDYFKHIWFLYMLQKAGYPFEKDDLSIEEWMDIAVLKDEIEALKFKMQK